MTSAEDPLWGRPPSVPLSKISTLTFLPMVAKQPLRLNFHTHIVATRTPLQGENEVTQQEPLPLGETKVTSSERLVPCQYQSLTVETPGSHFEKSVLGIQSFNKVLDTTAEGERPSRRRRMEPVVVGQGVASHSSSLAPLAWTELSCEQQAALNGLKYFISTLKCLPPSSFVKARGVITDTLSYIQQTGYPVDHFQASLQNLFSLCSSYSETLAKSSVEAGEARLKGLRDDLAAVKHKKQIEEGAQIKALARLQVLKEKYASLQAKCVARSNERNTVTSELDPSDEGTAAGEQGFLNLTKRVEAAEWRNGRLRAFLMASYESPRFDFIAISHAQPTIGKRRKLPFRACLDVW